MGSDTPNSCAPSFLVYRYSVHTTSRYIPGFLLRSLLKCSAIYNSIIHSPGSLYFRKHMDGFIKEFCMSIFKSCKYMQICKFCFIYKSVVPVVGSRHQTTCATSEGAVFYIECRWYYHEPFLSFRPHVGDRQVTFDLLPSVVQPRRSNGVQVPSDALRSACASRFWCIFCNIWHLF